MHIAEEYRQTVAESPLRGGEMRASNAARATWRAGRIVLVFALCVCCAVLIFAHLGEVPRTWFDEGSHLHVPKTLLQTGHYADRSSEGFRAFGPTIGVGPTVMLPIAAVFAVGGIGLLGARLVIALYSVIAIVAFVLLMRRLAGPRIALWATVLMLAAPALDFIMTGRQVLGEVPAFAYLICGVLVWFTRDDQTGEITLTHCSRRCLIAGAFFGLVVVTKSQLGIVLAPSLIVLAVLAARWERRMRPKQALIPLVVMLVVFAIWEIALLTIVTGGAFGENLALLRQASGGSLVVIAPHRMIAGARFLLGPNAYFALLIPALGYAVVRALRRRMAVGELVLLTFTLVGLAWFVGGSVAWPRYAFVPLALAALPVARLVEDGLSALRRTDRLTRYLAPLCALALGAAVLFSVVGQFETTFARPDDAPQMMAAYLNASLPTSAIIETWEPELGLLTDHHYHYPPPALLDQAVRHEWLNSPAITNYDPLAGGAAYLIIGPFGRYTGIYNEAAIAAQYPEIATIGDYTLYRLTPKTASARTGT